MHLLVVANETVAGRSLTDAVERRDGADLQVTVVCPGAALCDRVFPEGLAAAVTDQFKRPGLK